MVALSKMTGVITADDADPENGLKAVVVLRRLAERLERTHVKRARTQGWTWQQIGDALGVFRDRQSTRSTRGRATFERFMKDARPVVTLAVEEAQDRSDSRIGNEHLLLGVAGSGGAAMGLNLTELRLELDRLDGRALEAVGIDPGILDVGTSRSRERCGRKHLPFTRAAKITLPMLSKRR